jgi:hypothetical protein
MARKIQTLKYCVPTFFRVGDDIRLSDTIFRVVGVESECCIRIEKWPWWLYVWSEIIDFLWIIEDALNAAIAKIKKYVSFDDTDPMSDLRSQVYGTLESEGRSRDMCGEHSLSGGMSDMGVRGMDRNADADDRRAGPAIRTTPGGKNDEGNSA